MKKYYYYVVFKIPLRREIYLTLDNKIQYEEDIEILKKLIKNFYYDSELVSFKLLRVTRVVKRKKEK